MIERRHWFGWSKLVAMWAASAVGMVSVGVALATAHVATAGAQVPGDSSRRTVVAGIGASRIVGVVFDSLHGRPLADALVQLVPTTQITQGYSFRTGAEGDFQFERVPPGRYVIGFSHPILDSLSLQLPLIAVALDSVSVDSVSLFVPTAADLRHRICRSSDADSTGLLLTLVRSALDAEPVADANVEVRWRQIARRQGILEQVPLTLSGTTGPEGVLALCGVPVGVALDLVVRRKVESSGVFQVAVPADGLLQRDVFVGPSIATHLSGGSGTAKGARDTIADVNVRRGDGRLRGTVRGPLDRPIGGVRVTLAGGAVMSAADGTFVLDSLPLGTWPMSARALGFVPQTLAVDVLATRENVADLSLATVNVALDTVQVFGARPLAAIMAPFYKRRKEGWGRFLDEKQILARHPVRLSDLFRGMPGVYITEGLTGDRILLDRGAHDYCVPAFLLDGVRTQNFDGLTEGIVSITEIRGVEVYVRNPPMELSHTGGCGAIALWTGRQPVKGDSIPPR